MKPPDNHQTEVEPIGINLTEHKEQVLKHPDLQVGLGRIPAGIDEQKLVFDSHSEMPISIDKKNDSILRCVLGFYSAGGL